MENAASATRKGLISSPFIAVENDGDSHSSESMYLFQLLLLSENESPTDPGLPEFTEVKIPRASTQPKIIIA